MGDYCPDIDPEAHMEDATIDVEPIKAGSRIAVDIAIKEATAVVKIEIRATVKTHLRDTHHATPGLNLFTYRDDPALFLSPLSLWMWTVVLQVLELPKESRTLRSLSRR